jgi:formate dehydrogenase (NADP+) beta subunit
MQYPRGGFALPGTTLSFKTGTWRVQRPQHHHYAAPCHAACPAGEDAQAYLARIEEGDFKAAWETIVAVNPLPACTGRVCLHPCEGGCNRGKYDSAINIHGVERYLGDLAIQQGWAYPVTRPAADAPRVAVIGAGPAGVANAYHMLRRGFNVTLFDAFPEGGGTLRTGIPNYRLPDEVLDRELERIFGLGIEFRPHHQLGRDMNLRELQQDFPAIFLAPGTMKGRQWSVGDVTPQDLHQGLDLIKEWMTVGQVPKFQSAAVVGGGNTAIDVARILKRSGTPEVYIITHNGLPGPNSVPGDVMRAIPQEVEHAQEEGVKIYDHRGIRRLILRGGKVTGVEMVHMKKLPDERGKLRRVAFEGTETVLHVDQVIPAVGQVVAPAGMEGVLGQADFIPVDFGLRVSGHDGVWSGGDACSVGQGTVAGAVGDGRRAAADMAAYLHQLARPTQEKRAVAEYTRLNLNYFSPAARPEEPVLPVEARTGAVEIVGGLERAQVMHESERCFSCGNCLSCDNCWTLCPDSAVLKNPNAKQETDRYVFDYDYCKGCGLCATECPCGFIDMVEEI